MIIFKSTQTTCVVVRVCLCFLLHALYQSKDVVPDPTRYVYFALLFLVLTQARTKDPEDKKTRVHTINVSIPQLVWQYIHIANRMMAEQASTYENTETHTFTIR